MCAKSTPSVQPRVDLMQLVEEATEGCWIGHRARMFTSEIGSVYSPPKQDRQAAVVVPQQVETVIDIAHNARVSLVWFLGSSACH